MAASTAGLFETKLLFPVQYFTKLMRKKTNFLNCIYHHVAEKTEFIKHHI